MACSPSPTRPASSRTHGAGVYPSGQSCRARRGPLANFFWRAPLTALMLHSSTVVDEVATKLAVWARGTAPHPGTGARVEMGRRHLGRVVDLLGIGEGLTRQGLPAEEAPPAFL